MQRPANSTPARPIRMRFFSTFEPVTPLFETVLPALAARGIAATAVISRGVYRPTAWLSDPANQRAYLRHVWLPRIFRAQKRISAAGYWALAPFRLLCGRSELDIFLSEPPLFYVLGVWLARLLGRRSVVYLMDDQLALAQELGWLRRGAPLARVLTAAADGALRRADRVIILGRCMRERLIARGVAPDRLRIVHNWAAPGLELASPAPAGRAFRRAHQLENRFVVMYSGNIGLAHELRTILEAAARLRGSHPDLRVVFVGSGGRREEIARAAALPDSNVLLLPIQPRDQLHDSLAAADVHFISLRPGFEGLVVPSKFYGAAAVGRPILYEGHPDGEIARLVRELDCGSVVHARDVDGLVQGILRYAGDRAACASAGLRAQAAYRARFAPAHGTHACLAVLRELVPDLPDTP